MLFRSLGLSGNGLRGYWCRRSPHGTGSPPGRQLPSWSPQTPASGSPFLGAGGQEPLKTQVKLSFGLCVNYFPQLPQNEKQQIFVNGAQTTLQYRISSQAATGMRRGGGASQQEKDKRQTTSKDSRKVVVPVLLVPALWQSYC